MPGSLQAVLAIVLAVLPGALTVWGFERIAGRWTIGLSDRLLRFFGISAVLHALAAFPTYRIWHDYIRSGALDAEKRLPWWLWPVLVAYVLVPLAIGSLIAWGVETNKQWSKRFIASDPAPTAWDAVFSGGPKGWVLLKLKSGRWIGGAFDDDSYVGGYPEPPDIFLSIEAAVDQEEGQFARDEDGDIASLDSGALVRWDEVEYLRVLQRGDGYGEGVQGK